MLEITLNNNFKQITAHDYINGEYVPIYEIQLEIPIPKKWFKENFDQIHEISDKNGVRDVYYNDYIKPKTKVKMLFAWKETPSQDVLNDFQNEILNLIKNCDK